MQALPREYDGKIVFKLLAMQSGGPSFGYVDGMDLTFDGHPCCKSNNINMSNLPLGVKCRKVFCVGSLLCANETCAYKVKYGVCNRRYWKRNTTKRFLYDFIMSDETYTCIFCKNLAFCKSRCGACMFIIFGHLPSPRYSHLVCMLVYITILVPTERIKRLWTR